jgi:hypothetical protein
LVVFPVAWVNKSRMSEKVALVFIIVHVVQDGWIYGFRHGASSAGLRA